MWATQAAPKRRNSAETHHQPRVTEQTVLLLIHTFFSLSEGNSPPREESLKITHKVLWTALELTVETKIFCVNVLSDTEE